MFHVSTSVVSRLVAKHRVNVDVKDRARSGRPRKTSLKDDRHLVNMAIRNPFHSAKQLRQHWSQATGVNVSREMVNKRLLAAGLRARRPLKRPRLTPHHMQ